MPACSAASRASLLARTLKPMIAAPEASASVTSDSEMPPTPEWMMRAPTSSVPSFSSAPTIASTEPCTSPLMTSGNSLRPAVLTCAIICSSEPRMPAGARRPFALLARAVVGDFAGAGFALDHREPVAGVRRAVEAEHLDRGRRTGCVDGVARVGDQRAHAAPFGAGHHDVADVQRAALDQHGRDRAAAAIELRLDHGAFGGAVRIGLEVEDFGLQRDGLEQPCAARWPRGRGPAAGGGRRAGSRTASPCRGRGCRARSRGSRRRWAR